MLASKRFFGGDRTGSSFTLLIFDKTAMVKNYSAPILPLDLPAAAPEEAGRDYYRQNGQSWLLEPRFRLQLNYKLVSEDRDKSPSVSPRATGSSVEGRQPASGLLKLSRVGFDRSHRFALFSYIYDGGLLCGESGIVTLQENGTNWSVKDLSNTLEFGEGGLGKYSKHLPPRPGLFCICLLALELWVE